ncbi:ATP-grasp domain-containing protein [Mycena sp. CBHHK59/15]|nr:ATP-grasp domain-containing protein [Mycena sp. CBHHK59/15]
MSSLKNAGGMQFKTRINLSGNIPTEARWCINPPSEWFQTIDVSLSALPKDDTPGDQTQANTISKIEPENKAHQFLTKCIRLVATSPCSIKLITPTTEGFIWRTNFFERRLLDCPLADEIVGFLIQDRKAGPANLFAPLSDGFLSIVSSAAAGILLRPSTSTSEIAELAAIEEDLNARLAFNWLVPNPVPRRNVVLIEGYPHLQMGAGFIQAVKDLNVALMVIGPKGPKHWLEDPVNAEGFCEALIHVDLTFDNGLPSRIADAVRGYAGFHRVDGIFTAHDRYLVATAEVAALLGLPAAPARAHEISTDKYSMRQFAADSQAGDFQLFQFKGLDEVKRRLTSAEDPVAVSYPAIVKPISGFASEGVAKVNSNAELFDSIRRINTAKHGDVVIVETYIDGPEFDANFVLRDGEILFFEMTDDFPSPGDVSPGASTSAHFFETSELTPSGLPPTEREIVRASLHKILLELGFAWGLYHIEGRLKDSTMEYRADDSGIVDLRPRLDPRHKSPSCFLLEINARVPGVGCSFSTIHTYGVDFYAVPLLACIRDAQRLALIATPFRFPGRADGSQYWCQVVFIQPDRGGKFVSDDACGELVQRHPALAANISKKVTLYAKGATIPDPASGLCVVLAYILVYSRKSRQHVRELAEMVRTEFRYEII